MNKFKTFISDKENLTIFITMILNFVLMIVLIVGGSLVLQNQINIENKAYSSLFFTFATYELIGIFINWNYYKDNISFSEVFIYNLLFSLLIPSFVLYYINREQIIERRNKNKEKLKVSRENLRKKINERKNTKKTKVDKNNIKPVYLTSELNIVKEDNHKEIKKEIEKDNKENINENK